MKAIVSVLLLVSFIGAISAQFLTLQNVKPIIANAGNGSNVTTLNLNSINGTWYSIASTSSVVEAGCHCQRTTYLVQSDNKTILVKKLENKNILYPFLPR